MKYLLITLFFSFTASAKFVHIEVIKPGEEKVRFSYTVDPQRKKVWEIRDLVMRDSGLNKKDYILVKTSKNGFISLNLDNPLETYGEYSRSQVLFYVVPKDQEIGKEEDTK